MHNDVFLVAWQPAGDIGWEVGLYMDLGFFSGSVTIGVTVFRFACIVASLIIYKELYSLPWLLGQSLEETMLSSLGKNHLPKALSLQLCPVLNTPILTPEHTHMNLRDLWSGCKNTTPMEN